MSKKRIVQRRSARTAFKRQTLTMRLRLPALAVLGIAIMGAMLFLNFRTVDCSQPIRLPNAPLSPACSDLPPMQEARSDNQMPEEQMPEEQAAALPQDLPVAEAPREPELVRMTDTVRSGDTPTTLLSGHLDMNEIHALCNESKSTYPLHKLRAGQPWTMIYAENALVGLEYEIDANERLVVSMTDNGYEFRREPIPYDLETGMIVGTIERSLFNTVLDLGESEDLAIRLAKVFAYDVDFVRDLRSGDTFKVIVQKKSRNGQFAGYGNLIAASFTNQGQTYHAYWYTDRKGHSAYYDQHGKPLRKAFLKSPLPFTRISSGYSMNRLHPILGFRRPHQGIDYAAPTGTPIFTVADGNISSVGTNKSQGRFVCVKHPNGYETIYNHMSKFAPVSKKGTSVKQGAVIGYVGSTGYATGPHLDFRMRCNGQLINPLTLKVMPAEPIAAREMPAFQAAIATCRSQLESPVAMAASPN